MYLANFALPGRPDVGTGPFRLESRKPSILLRAFDGYRSGRPAIDTVKMAEYQTQRQAWAAMMRGEADVLHDVSVESLDFVTAESTVQTYSFVKAYYDALVFNLTLPLFAQKDVRRALNSAINREQVLEVGLRKRGVVSDGPIWPYHYGRSQDQPTYKYDPDQAEALFDGLGLKRGRTQEEPGRMPSRFRFTCLIPTEDQRMHRMALVIQKELFNVGVDMDVDVMPFGDLAGRVVKGDFEAALVEFPAYRSLNNVYATWHSVAPGVKAMDMHYSSADAALDKLRAAIHDEDVRAAVADLQRVFYQDPPAVFLQWVQTTRAVSKSVDVQNEPGRDVLGTLPQWRPVSSQSTRR
jgi:peptide/nickel transport system substrate-binding protein